MKFAASLVISFFLTKTVVSFGTIPFHHHANQRSRSSLSSFNNVIITSLNARTYGPTDDPATPPPPPGPTAEQKSQFITVFDEVMNCNVRDHLPSILTSNIELLLQLQGKIGASMFNEHVGAIEATGDEEMIERAHASVEYIVYFLEAFVAEAKLLDDTNKKLLGKILICMTEKDDGENRDDPISKQDKLDGLIRAEKGNFTPGFLRHLDGECVRIANAKKMDKDTTKLLEIMRIIQTRIIEELGQDLGEGAQVLGQLLGYESSEERIAVLDAGLKVRGTGFAKDLKVMTVEALLGFKNVPGGVDPGLLKIVEEMDDRIHEFISSN
eukprot:scaffold2292_cov259-Chaetoceros_neogracile.AAC.5